MHRRLSLRSRLGVIVTALLAALGSSLLVVSPVSASTVVYTSRFVEHFVSASTARISPDGCIQSYTSVNAGMIPRGSGQIVYSASAYNRCTGQGQFVFGNGPMQVFDFKPNTAHVVATVPLSDGTQIYFDLTWQGTGVTQHTVNTFSFVVPGQYVEKTNSNGAIQQATATGTQSFDSAFIGTTRNSYLTVTIEKL